MDSYSPTHLWPCSLLGNTETLVKYLLEATASSFNDTTHQHRQNLNYDNKIYVKISVRTFPLFESFEYLCCLLCKVLSHEFDPCDNNIRLVAHWGRAGTDVHFFFFFWYQNQYLFLDTAIFLESHWVPHILSASSTSHL